MEQTERDRVNEAMVRRYGEMNSQYGLSEVTTLEDALNLDIETGEHMRLNLSALDRIIWEEAQTISDGKALFEHMPSSLTPHHRYGMRLNKKYGAGKRAFLAAYMLHMVSGIEQESREWFESLCEEGFDRAFEQLFGLYSELRRCDARDTDVMGKIEGGMGDGSLYHAVEIVGEDETEYMPSENEVLYSLYAKKIRRAGRHQIGAIGKELYAEKRLANYEMTLLWNQYKARKSELQKFCGA
jgi:hypothetical protein